MINPADAIIKASNPPEAPGVYLMHDAKDEIIYVGKAITLKNRLSSYRRPLDSLDPKTRAMVTKIARVEFMVTDSEIEALMLEYTLIKKHRPKYNVLMRDDKSYPYLKITQDEYYPRLVVTRKPYVDQGHYYGPYVGLPAKLVARELVLAFGLCPKKIPLQGPPKNKRACLYYQMKRCTGACLGLVSLQDYRKQIRGLMDFMEGRKDSITPKLKRKMNEAAAREDFEAAAAYRDQLEHFARVRNLPSVRSADFQNKDFLALARSGQHAAVELFHVRAGNLEGRRNFSLQHVGLSSESELHAQVITQYYAQPVDIPATIILRGDPADKPLLLKWLETKKESPVVIRQPENDEEQRLLAMADTNAWLYLKHQDETWSEGLSEESRQVLEDVKKRLSLEQLPVRIEGYDISNISGQDAVGSRVVFTNGLPDKQEYRRYKINSISGPNDFAMMQEMLFRRFKRLQEEGAKVPDLVVVDGGAGQLSAGLQVLQELGLTHISMIGLAKKHEEIYQPGQMEPLQLAMTSPTIGLLTRLRDEAHRFAITYHRKLRSKRLQASVLDQIEGLGPVKKRRLLQQCGSVEAILNTSIEGLQTIAGIDKALALAIHRHLKKVLS